MAAVLLTGATLLVCLIAPQSPIGTEGQLGHTDADFWTLVQEFSEPGEFFRSDNFVSNEVPYQHVIPELSELVGTGSVYLGVGPAQNYTYIAATRPELAFIMDIRSQNMLQHLLDKSVFELSVDRVEFLARLFSRPVPIGLEDASSIDEIIGRFGESTGHPELFAANLEDVLYRLKNYHQFELEPGDRETIEYVYEAFIERGPSYATPPKVVSAGVGFPPMDLVIERDTNGKKHNYLATEFRFVKRLHEANRIIPLVGDFAGEKSLVAIGDYLRDRDLTVSTFYTSHVEYYPFQGERWRRFFKSVALLPLNSNSTFIRAYFNNYGYRHPSQQARHFSVTLLDSIPNLVADFQGAAFGIAIRSSRDFIEYGEHVACSEQAAARKSSTQLPGDSSWRLFALRSRIGSFRNRTIGSKAVKVRTTSG